MLTEVYTTKYFTLRLSVERFTELSSGVVKVNAISTYI